MKKTTTTTNSTLLRLKGTPFRKASEMKAHEEQILTEEWTSIERARVRRELLMREENRKIIAPFTKGFSAKFIGADGSHENLVRVYMTDDEAVQVEIDHQLKSDDINATMESLVKSMTESFMNGYLATLGLKDEALFKTATKKTHRSG